MTVSLAVEGMDTYFRYTEYFVIEVKLVLQTTLTEETRRKLIGSFVNVSSEMPLVITLPPAPWR